MTEAHAPGKLVVCGEYAVLAGAPAIAVAMEARARARVTDAGNGGSLAVADGGTWAFVWQDGLPRWREIPPDGQGRILEAVAATLADEGAKLSVPLDIRLDTRAFRVWRADGRADKLGLGSSAALTVALTAALLAHAGRACTARAQLFDICARAHRRFQEGAGSGIDVATAVHGGVVLLAGGEIRPLAWPAGLAWLPVWSGAGASTREMLDRYKAFRDADPARFGRQTAVLREIAVAAASAWEGQEIQALLRSLADYDDALRALDSGAGLGIYTPAHDRFARIAQRCGAVYKTSGAGGGDFGIALADSLDIIDRVAAAFAAERALTLPGSHGAGGVDLG